MLLTIISGFLFFVAILCLGVVLIINCRGFYHLLVEPLHIVSESGLAKELILRNYDHLIDYCSPFYQGGLSFPDFPSSDSALSHFAETKVLFLCFYLGVPVCCLLGVGMIGLKAWGRQAKALPQIIISDTISGAVDVNRVYTGKVYTNQIGVNRISLQERDSTGNGSFFKHFLMEFSHSLRFAAWMCVLVPVMCFVLFLADFHKAFYGMHHVFFRNDDWIFDAATDPVITILPERYFLCCGVGIAVLLLLGAVGIGLVRKYLKRLYERENMDKDEDRHAAKLPAAWKL